MVVKSDSDDNGVQMGMEGGVHVEEEVVVESDPGDDVHMGTEGGGCEVEEEEVVGGKDNGDDVCSDNHAVEPTTTQR